MEREKQERTGGVPALVGAMLLFGTIGLFRRWIPLPSGRIAMFRGGIGALFLLATALFGKRKPDFSALKGKLPLLLLSGALLGGNWMLLFEAYRFTSVAVASVCYYTAPVLVILAAWPLFHEKLTLRSLLCAGAALLGTALISGLFRPGAMGAENGKGVLLGLGAAALYAGVVLLNKQLKGVPAFDRTVCQLLSAALVLLPYTLLLEPPGEAAAPLSIALLVTVGVVHTGVAYLLYFGAMGSLRARTVALLSYIDPVTAILLSALLLGEPLGPMEICGAGLVLGAAAVSELPGREPPGKA